MNKSAREMFEELGYSEENTGDIKCYFNSRDNVEIRFYETNYGHSIKISDDCYMSTFIGIDELKAINKQVEELGWNE